MKAVFWIAEGKQKELLLAKAFCEGFKIHGHECELRPTHTYNGPAYDCDLALIMGVKGISQQCLRDHIKKRINVIYIDKGYVRLRSLEPNVPLLHYRFSINAFQPLDYFQQRPKPADRWKALGYQLKPRKYINGSIIFAGSSQKYCNWHNLGNATDYAQKNIRRIRKIIKRSIIYRPKPSWHEAIPIEGTTFSHGKRRLTEDLKEAFALVTFGSNAAFDAIVEGIPVVVLGDSIARPIANTKLEELKEPFFPNDQQRWQWCCDLAYCQWTLDELRSGEAWHYLQNELPQCVFTSKAIIPQYHW